MKKSITQRIKITRTGKMKRRATTLGHSRSNKSGVQYRRKKRSRDLSMAIKKIIMHV